MILVIRLFILMIIHPHDNPIMLGFSSQVKKYNRIEIWYLAQDPTVRKAKTEQDNIYALSTVLGR